MKKILGLFLVLLSILTLTSCNQNIELKDKKISHETKFGGIYIEITIDDFNKEGFAYGDSVDISFSNGYKLDDLPYYNGYYTDTGQELLVGYPGYPYIKACINNGNDLYGIAKLKDTDTATIKLKEKGKYKAIQDALDIHYTDVQGDISNEVFGNYRVVNSITNMKENTLYRSASPIDNQHNRAHVVDSLITDIVNTIIDLSDTSSEINEHIEASDFASPYFKSLYDAGNVIALSMNMNFRGANGQDDTPSLFTEFKDNTFAGKLVSGLRFILEHDGPYLVHCVEGKDRTGFVCMVIEALGGATYDEIINDYMITYDNYYGINKTSDLSKYNIIKEKNIDVMLKTIVNDDNVDIKTADYGQYIETYLISKGMTSTEVQNLKTKLRK